MTSPLPASPADVLRRARELREADDRSPSHCIAIAALKLLPGSTPNRQELINDAHDVFVKCGESLLARDLAQFDRAIALAESRAT